MDFEKANIEATQLLVAMIKNNPRVTFSEEKPTGFRFETNKGSFWFQCEVEELKEDN